MVAASPKMQEYFATIQKEVEELYKIANAAKSKGVDPDNFVDIPLARNMAERVEGIIIPAAPQIKGKGISTRIEELEQKFGKLDWRVALTIGLEVAQSTFCAFETTLKAMEVGIRVGIAYLTLGVVASPLEGFTELKLKKRRDGKEYFCLMFSGPIRSAGGTAAATSLLLADYIRINMGYHPYDPTEQEVKRAVTEIYDYHERVTNVQYLPSPEEIEFLLSRVPVQVDGVPSEDIEVSNYKDLPRIETNRIRNGICLVLAEGLAQKAPKLHKQLSKWGQSFGLEGWSFLNEFVEIQKRIKAGKALPQENNKEKVAPDYTYIKDLVAGRPVLTYPLREGGFRLRYGRGRTTGYSAAGIHPATMVILNDYIAIGTQLKVERPGKAATINSIDSIEGPIVRLTNGSVVRFDTPLQAKALVKEIEEILFLGDILFNYGDFFNRAHKLLPPGYCEEWWVLELQAAIKQTYDSVERATQESGIDIQALILYPNRIISGKEAIRLSTLFSIPLHPRHTPHFRLITSSELANFAKHLEQARVERNEEHITKIILTYDDLLKKSLDAMGLIHEAVFKEFLVLAKDEAIVMHTLFANPQTATIIATHSSEPTLNIINLISPFAVRDKSGYFIGARMGRPEKAKIRKLTGSPHVLFPVGEEGGRLRSFQAAMQDGKITADFPVRFCNKCSFETLYSICEKCQSTTEQRYSCVECGVLQKSSCRHGEQKTFNHRSIDINYYFTHATETLKLKAWPDLIKGVRGTSNKNHVPEHLMKGILRAKHELAVNKDGTIRYDMTQMPLTHFKPSEIRTSLETLERLGYTQDIFGKPITQIDQIIELKPQDIVLPACPDADEEGADAILFRSASFCDELLTTLYGVKPYYGISNSEGLAGQLVVALAPHTSAGIVARIIGFSKTQAFYAHPMIHAATRRDCVHPNTRFVYANKKGIQVEQIGPYVEQLLSKKAATKKIDAQGTIRIETAEELYALSIDHKTKKVRKKKIKYFIKGPAPKKWVKITTASNRNYTMTPTHDFLHIENDVFVFKKAHEVQVGDNLPILNSFPKDKEIKSLNILELLLDNLSTEKLSNIYITFANKDILLSQLKEKQIKHIPKHSRLRIKFSTTSFPIILPITKEFTSLLGYYLAEGYSRQNSTVSQVSFRIKDREIQNKVISYVKKAFNLDVNLGENNTKITICDQLVYYVFTLCLKMGSTAYEKKIPSLLFSVSKKHLIAFLSAFIAGDGTVTPQNQSIVFYSVSRTLLDDIALLLAKLKVFARYQTTAERSPGRTVLERYKELGKKPKKHILHHLVIKGSGVGILQKALKLSAAKKAKLTLGKISAHSDKTQFEKEYHLLQNVGDIVIDYVKKIEFIKDKVPSYCVEIDWQHKEDRNIVWGEQLVNTRCDGDEASVTLLLDVLLNFSRNYLPNTLGATQDAPLVITSLLVPSEVDDMVFDVDVVSTYGLAFYQACQQFKNPWEVPMDKIGSRLNTPSQYEGMMFTHDTSSLNNGVLCSSYKTIPSMQEKLLGQMELADKIRAVDKADVARLVIEKHFLPDIKGNLRKFSQQEFRCVACNEKFRRPPLRGNCSKCAGKLIFTVSEGNIIKYLEPSISMAQKYNLPAYLIQTLELTQQRIESVFGRDKERQEGLGKWFG